MKEYPYVQINSVEVLPEPVTVTLRFANDYSVRTADNGYCYHGFCSPTITRYLEGEPQELPEEAPPETEAGEEETPAEP